MSYFCKYGLIHDKPCQTTINESGIVETLPSSNNGWIYTAFYSKFEHPSFIQLAETNSKCKRIGQLKELSLIRLPGKFEPPMSRDEVIGMFSLGFISVDELIENDWYFCGIEPSWYSWPRVLWEMFKIRKEHRNHFWENKIFPVYRAAFRVWHHDRFYFKFMHGMTPSFFETIAFILYLIITKIKGTPGEKNILWLQLSDMNFDPGKNFFKEYFGEYHPISKAARDD